jgi:hypothetical protein
MVLYGAFVWVRRALNGSFSACAAFGIVLWELATRRLPYEGSQPIQAAMAVLHQNRRPGSGSRLGRVVALCYRHFSS